MLTLIANSPRILISRQTIGIEIDSSIAYRYAAPHLLPCYLVFTYSVPYVILSSVPLLLCFYILLSIMSLWLLFPCYHVFTYSVQYVIMASVPLLPCLLLLLSIMSLWLSFPCYFVFTYSVHYVIMSSASFCLSFGTPLCKLFLSSYHFVDNCLNRGGGISSLFVSHF